MRHPLRRRSDSSAPPSATLRVLVVEDDPDDRTFVSVLLRRLDFAVSAASNGTEALAQVEAQSFDLLVIDCEMPGMSGLEVIAEVRAHRNGAETLRAHAHRPWGPGNQDPRAPFRIR